MSQVSYPNMCIFHTLDGLRDGLSHFSEPSRVALIYAVRPEDPIRVYDPQKLLLGHEPILKEIYLDSGEARKTPTDLEMVRRFGQIQVEKNLDLAGLISCGGRSYSIFYQMWFTEHHPDICSTGPTERWLEHAAWLLSNDFASDNIFCTGTSGYVLREYATHAVRDYLVDKLNLLMGMDTQLRVYPILDAVLGISNTREEGAWPRGSLIFVESRSLATMNFMARFPSLEQPTLENYKHIRKLLQAVEGSERKLISDGKNIAGIAADQMPNYCIAAEFRGKHGFISLNGERACSFADGSFHSTTFLAKLVQLEEALLESEIDNAQCILRPVSWLMTTPPTLQEWLEQEGL